jgi:hypothetical protein
MIPLTPTLLVAAANAFVGLGEEGADNHGQMVELFLREVNQLPGQPWCLAFVHHVGFWSHFDHRMGKSSWPLPPTASCSKLGEVADGLDILKDKPMDGDVFLVFSQKKGRFHHAGVVLGIDACEPMGYLCTVVDGNTNSDGSENGYTTLRHPRRFKKADRFVRWVDLANRVTAE